MDELEINPEGQSPQEPEAVSPEHAEAAGTEQGEVSVDAAPEGATEAPDVWPSPSDSPTSEPAVIEPAAEELDTEVAATAEAPAPAAMQEAPPSETAEPEQPDAASDDGGETADILRAEAPEPYQSAEPEAAENTPPEAPDVWPSANDSSRPADAALEFVAPEAVPVDEVAAEALLSPDEQALVPARMGDVQLMAVLEAVIYVAEEPLTLAQIAAAIAQPAEHVGVVLRQLIAEMEKPERGIAIREVAGGFKMATKAEHHEAVRNFVKSLKPPMKLSLPALETLAVIAYKQPVTAPEIMEIRGVQGAGVLKTLLDRKLIAVAGRKNVIGKPILYKTTRDFLIQFGLNDVNELPSLKEFEEIRRMAFADSEPAAPATEPESVATQPTPSADPQAAPDVASETAPETGPEQES